MAVAVALSTKKKVGLITALLSRSIHLMNILGDRKKIKKDRQKYEWPRHQTRVRKIIEYKG